MLNSSMSLGQSNMENVTDNEKEGYQGQNASLSDFTLLFKFIRNFTLMSHVTFFDILYYEVRSPVGFSETRIFPSKSVAPRSG